LGQGVPFTVNINIKYYFICYLYSNYFIRNLFGQEIEGNLDESNEVLKETWTSEQLAFSALKELKSDPEAFYQKLIKKLFIEDIEKIKGIEELWKDRLKPNSFEETDLIVDLPTAEDLESVNDHQIWDLSQWIKLFKSAIFRLISRNSEVVFDKDDVDTLDLVASAANLRAKVFGIELKSKFDIKAMAGNIIPAIATTNAIAAAMIIIHAKNILKGHVDDYCNAYINYGSSNSRNIFSIEKPCNPNPDCTVCSTDRALIKVDCFKTKLRDLLTNIMPLYLTELRNQFPNREIPDIDEEDVTVLEGNRLLYDIDDDNGNGSKTLAELGVTDSKFLRIDISPRRPLLLGIIQTLRETSENMVVDFDLIQPKTLKRKLEETDQEASESADFDSEDDLICIDEKDDTIEIIKVDIKKPKIGIGS
jgi:ubiquitin-like 1-activating enzyme E1 B